MRIIEHNTTRLQLQHRQSGLAIGAALFVVLSSLMTLNLVIQGAQRIDGLNRFQALSWVLWIGLGAVFVVMGTVAWARLGRGTTCTFDKASESVVIRRSGFVRMNETSHSIYGVSGLEIVPYENDKSAGLMLVLRSGQRLPLAALNRFEQDDGQALVVTVRRFLHDRTTPAAV